MILNKKDLSKISLNLSFLLSLLDIENGNLIFPLKINIGYKSEVVDGSAPSPCIILCPTGMPLIIIAFKTPSIPAVYELS